MPFKDCLTAFLSWIGLYLHVPLEIFGFHGVSVGDVSLNCLKCLDNCFLCLVNPSFCDRKLFCYDLKLVWASIIF